MFSVCLVENIVLHFIELFFFSTNDESLFSYGTYDAPNYTSSNRACHSTNSHAYSRSYIETKNSIITWFISEPANNTTYYSSTNYSKKNSSPNTSLSLKSNIGNHLIVN